MLVSGPTHGILSLTNNGGFSYQPTNNYAGIDTFTYQATDGQNTSAVATVAIDVLPPADFSWIVSIASTSGRGRSRLAAGRLST